MGNLDFMQGFDASAEAPRGEFEPIAPGEYVATVIDHGFKTTKAGTGEYLELVWEIVTDGDAKGRQIRSRLNLNNPNPKAVKIATQEFAEVCRAVGINAPKDTSELKNKMARIQVDVEERNDKPGQYNNRIVAYNSTTGVAPSRAERVAQAVSTGAANAAKKPAWKK